VSIPWLVDDAEPNADMFAAPDESREQLVELYRRVWAHSDATIAALPLDAVGTVAWWPPERARVTLHAVLVHMIAEAERHAGHADIARELIDGMAGVRPDNHNLPGGDAAWWSGYRARVEAAAEQAAKQAGRSGSTPPA
jgi:hypothetical protein